MDKVNNQRETRKNKALTPIHRGWKLNSHKGYICCAFIILLLIIAVGFIKWPRGEVNYRNSDATWHTLLTMKCYDETPASVHKYLPIVSLGEERDKGIPWGATIPDEYGNYYYTSFSPMGFVVPYFFVKLLHLDFTEKSLFLFNLLLLFLSCIIIVSLFREIWGDSLNFTLLFGIICVYVLSPEIMHGMGIVYWHQSLMQVFLPLQILLYYKYIKGEGRLYYLLFLFMCIINPYTEWSGYVANGGFFIAELIRCRRKPLKEYLSVVYISLATVGSFALFTIHYLSTVEKNVFFDALENRFLSRNITAGVPWKDLFYGYWTSFTAILIVFLVSLCVYVYSHQRQKVGKNEWLILFVSSFPILENAIMKEHAVSYSYDRMKLALPLMLVIYWCIHSSEIHRSISAMFIMICISLSFAIPYKTSSGYIWETNYRIGNRKLAAYINKNYDDSVLGFKEAVRGYLNMTLGRGCFEAVYDPSLLEPYASDHGCRYIVVLRNANAKGKDTWSMFKLNAYVYDRVNGSIVTISNKDTDIAIRVYDENQEGRGD